MAGGGAGYGTNTTGEGPASPYGATAPDSTMSDNFGGSVSSTPTNQYAVEDRAAAINRAYQFSLGRAPEQGGYDFWTDTGNRLNWSPAQAANAVNTAGAPERAQQQADIYANLTRPSGDVIHTAYAQALGRAPDAEGANFWANEAQRCGWTGQQLAENISLAGAPERAQSGFQSQLIPQNYTAQRVGTTPSYYNTNPVAVDYANIFNPRAGQVTFDRATLSPQQQAQYLQGWQTDYSNRLQRGVANARAQRVANAQKAQEDYNTKKAQAEAQAAASNQEAINRAVQEALAQQQAYSNNNNNYNFYSGNTGGLASLAKRIQKMTTSGTASFNLDLNDIIEEAFERAGTEVRSGYDLRTARRSMNLMLADWANRGINLWTVEEGSIPLEQGVYEYDLPNDTVDLIEHVIRTSPGQEANQQDLTISRISVSTYATIPNKLNQARPIQIYVDRQTPTPNVKLWPVPNQGTTESPYYTLVYWRLRRIQDADTGTNTMDVPFRFLPCLVAGLAYYVALKDPHPGAYERVGILKQMYDESFELAATEDREKAPVRFVPRQQFVGGR